MTLPGSRANSEYINQSKRTKAAPFAFNNVVTALERQSHRLAIEHGVGVFHTKGNFITFIYFA